MRNILPCLFLMILSTATFAEKPATLELRMGHKLLVSTQEILQASAASGSSGAVVVRINDAGAKKLARVAKKHKKKPFTLLLDGKVIQSPIIETGLSGDNFQFSGNFTKEEAIAIARRLQAAVIEPQKEIFSQEAFQRDFFISLKGMDPSHLASFFSSKSVAGTCKTESQWLGAQKASVFVIGQFRPFQDKLSDLRVTKEKSENGFLLFFTPYIDAEYIYRLEVAKEGKKWLAIKLEECAREAAKEDPLFMKSLPSLSR